MGNFEFQFFAVLTTCIEWLVQHMTKSSSLSTEFYVNLRPSSLLFLGFVFCLRILALLLKDSKRYRCFMSVYICACSVHVHIHTDNFTISKNKILLFNSFNFKIFGT